MIRASVLAILFVLSAGAAVAEPSARPPLDGRPSLAAYQAYQGESFEVWGGAGARPVESLTLVEIRDHGSGERIEQFSLRFRGELASTLVQGGYSFRHPQSGYFDLWLEPAGQDEHGRYLEARFSLIPARARP
jgi:hypothetical protein